jgi:hypothetical protein
VTTPRPLGVHLIEAPGPRLFVVLWGGLALVDLARAWHAPALVALALLGGLVVACSVGQVVGVALAVAGVAWLVVTGFVVNTDGALRISGPADAVRLALLGAVAVLVARAHR